MFQSSWERLLGHVRHTIHNQTNPITRKRRMFWSIQSFTASNPVSVFCRLFCSILDTYLAYPSPSVFCRLSRGIPWSGYFESGQPAIEIAGIVSQDLPLLAPVIENFIDRLDIPMHEMNEMLLDQKNTGDTWEQVTCRWIKANRPLWQKWIPDESHWSTLVSDCIFLRVLFSMILHPRVTITG